MPLTKCLRDLPPKTFYKLGGRFSYNQLRAVLNHLGYPGAGNLIMPLQYMHFIVVGVFSLEVIFLLEIMGRMYWTVDQTRNLSPGYSHLIVPS